MTPIDAEYREMARRAAARNNLEGFGKPQSHPKEATPPPLTTQTIVADHTWGCLYPYSPHDAMAVAADYDLPSELSMQLADLTWHQTLLKRAQLDLMVAATRFEAYHFGKIAVELEASIDALTDALASIDTARTVVELQEGASC